MIVPLLLIIALFALITKSLQIIESTIQTKKYNQSYVEQQPENYIPIPFDHLLKAIEPIWNSKSQSIDELNVISQKIEYFYFLNFNNVENNVLNAYHQFDPTTKSKTRGAVDDYQTEQQFLKDWRTILEKANFKQITQKELDFALQEDYKCTLPVEVDWNKLDGRYLSRYLSEHPEVSSDLPEFSNKIWIFSRGVGIDRTNDLLVIEKIDVIIVRLLRKIIHLKYILSNKLFKTPIPESDEAPVPATHSGNSKIIERVTLQQSIHFEKDGFKILSQKTALQEPTFKELIVLYKLKSEDPKVDAPIHIMSYQDIPMADLEVALPCSSASLRPLDIFIFAITGCIGIISALFKYFETESSTVGSVTFIGFIGLLAKSGYDYWNLMYYYRSIITDILFSRFKDANSGVIVSTIHSTRRQELKEAFLAYCFLIIRGPSNEKDLDEEVEKFLQQLSHGDDRLIDFESDDALRKLIDLGIATLDGETYTAVAPNQAVEILKKRT